MKTFWAGVGLLTGLVLMLGLKLIRPYAFHGTVIEPAISAPEIDLTSTSGGRFSLAAGENKVTLVFFGYTSCPDVCPITLGEMRQLSEMLAEKSKDVQFVFVTIDPERDTLERLQKYLAAFDPAFIGLTGNMADLSKVWNAYGITREVELTSSAAGVLISHSARLYLIDRQDRLRLTYTFGTPVEDIQQDILYLLKNE
ncbi:MAG: SCO family protein [Anaerolineae bacterium]|nr:SCO family protein [Anaerolineae bacterium]